MMIGVLVVIVLALLGGAWLWAHYGAKVKEDEAIIQHYVSGDSPNPPDPAPKP